MGGVDIADQRRGYYIHNSNFDVAKLDAIVLLVARYQHCQLLLGIGTHSIGGREEKGRGREEKGEGDTERTLCDQELLRPGSCLTCPRISSTRAQRN